MRTCPNCGATVADTDDFCGNCGTYLAWLKPEPGEDQPQLVDQPADINPAAPMPAAPAEPVPAAPAEPVPAAPAAPMPAAPAAPAPVAPAAPAPVAPAEPAPVAPAEPAPEQPRAVAPTRPVAQRRPRTAPQVSEPTQSGPACKVCGTVNPLSARFCRRCGTSLIDTAAPQQVRWRRRLTWPRWLRFWETGESPWPRRIVVLIVLAALVVAGFQLYPLLYPVAINLGQGLRDKLSTAAPISPSQTTANAAVPGHPVPAIVDDVTNQYWGAPAVGDWAQFTFPQPFRLLGVVITPGASTDPNVFNQQARPIAVDLVITTSTGATTTLPITLADKPGPQTTNTGISNVTTIRLVIRAATPVAPDQSIALGEIEFFKRA